MRYKSGGPQTDRMDFYKNLKPTLHILIYEKKRCSFISVVVWAQSVSITVIILLSANWY